MTPLALGPSLDQPANIPHIDCAKRPYGSISDVRHALESPWPCDELERGLSSRRRCLPSFFATLTGHETSWEGLSLKPRAQLTFSSWNKVKAFGKHDATNLAQVHHSFVRARREPLGDHVDVAGVASRPCATRHVLVVPI